MNKTDLGQLETLLNRFGREVEHGLTHDSFTSFEPDKFTISDLYEAIENAKE